jgi:hypothetical protein
MLYFWIGCQKSPAHIWRIRLQCFTALLLVTIGNSGCQDTSKVTKQQSESKGAARSNSAPANSEAQVDESLTSEEYLRLGLPAQDRDWSSEDMANAAKILESLAQKGYRQLPRYKSERSGEIFARMTSAQNLDLFKNRTLLLDARFPQAADYLQASNQISKLYLTGFLKKEVRDSEIMEWMGSQFRMTVIMLDLVDEFLPSIKKDDPSFEARMQGLDQMKRGLASVVAGGLQTLTESESYRPSERIRLIGYMEETFPAIVPQLPPASRQETLLRLEKMKVDLALKELQPGLETLHSKVKASVENGAAH